MSSVEPTVEAMRAEISRLGAELDECEQATRAAELAAGELRGQLSEVRVQLGRARQAQEWAETGGPTTRERSQLSENAVDTAQKPASASARGSVRKLARSLVDVIRGDRSSS